MNKLTDDERKLILQVRDDRGRPADNQVTARELALFLVVARRLNVLASELNAECLEIQRAVESVLMSRG